MARLLLEEIAIVDTRDKDIGLDLHGELRADPSLEFYVQAKGSSNFRFFCS